MFVVEWKEFIDGLKYFNIEIDEKSEQNLKSVIGTLLASISSLMYFRCFQHEQCIKFQICRVLKRLWSSAGLCKECKCIHHSSLH